MIRRSVTFGLLLVALGCAGSDPGAEATAGAGGVSQAGGAGASAGGAGGGTAGSGNGGVTQSGGNPSTVAGSGGVANGGQPTTGAAGSAAGGFSAGNGGIGGIATGGSSPQAGAAGTAGSAGAPPDGPLVALKIYLAGDSTVSKYTDTASTSDQAGWGQMLHENLNDLASVDNRAVGGRTSRRFIEEGYLAKILTDIRSGDYLFVQFGTNDSNKTATYTFDGQTVDYYLDPATDFKTYLQKYIDGAREHQATPVLVTPPPRNSAYCTGGNGTGAYAEAMRELGATAKVAVVDLNRKAVDYLKAICPSPTPEDFFLRKADGSVDGTHFQEHGARVLAGFVADGVVEAKLPLARYVK